MRISAKDLIPGMKLERPVMNKNGLMMIGADTELTEVLIEKIRKMDIQVVYVHGASKALPPREEALAQLERRFRNVEGAPHMDVIKKLLREHIEGLYEAMDLKTLRSRIETFRPLPRSPGSPSACWSLWGTRRFRSPRSAAFISHDPVLTSKVLKMVNSPIYGFPGRISSVNQAVLLLGLNVVRGLLFGVTVFDLMQQTMIGLWEHSMGCAILSRLMAEKKGFKDLEEASIHGLLHDIGKVVLVLKFPTRV